tara:strand:+ start:2334 stop:2522 length:189 start_codon:yes stop_codon:yes gene_type:complete
MKECTVVHTQTITKTYYIDAEDGDAAEEILEYGRLSPEQLAEALFYETDSNEYECTDEGEEF